MSDMGRLAHLALNPGATASREEIYLAVASLYRIQGSGLNARERELMREILRRLTHDVEMAIRIALAERLSEDTTAPHDLILLLVDDRIEVARPLIINSPLLTEDDVLRLIAESDLGHQEAVASRPHIGESVTDALAQSQHESVLLALVRNLTARISNTAYETLVDKSRAITGLQDPLVRRTDLPPQLATRMCGWVSDALQTYIKTNYSLASKRLEAALSDAHAALQSEPAVPQDSPADSAQRLIEKMAGSGQLKPGFLMRVLSQGRWTCSTWALRASSGWTCPASARPSIPAACFLGRWPVMAPASPVRSSPLSSIFPAGPMACPTISTPRTNLRSSRSSSSSPASARWTNCARPVGTSFRSPLRPVL